VSISVCLESHTPYLGFGVPCWCGVGLGYRPCWPPGSCTG